MSELYFQAPTEEERYAQYKGMTFEEFNELPDEEAAALKVAARDEWYTANMRYRMEDQEWWDALDTTKVFNSFCEWRQYGLPDRNLSNEDFLGYMQHYYEIRKAKDPNYGQAEADLTKDEAEAVYWLLWRADNEDGEPVFGDTEHELDICSQNGVSFKPLLEKNVIRKIKSERIKINPSSVLLFSDLGKTHYTFEEPFLATHLVGRLGLNGMYGYTIKMKHEDPPIEEPTHPEINY